MLDFVAMRNPSVERPGLPVTVSADRCQSAGISEAYAGLFGIVIGFTEQTGEALVSLDEASHRRFLEIERAAFSEAFRDLDEDQWFCSGVLEVVQQESEEDMSGEIITTQEALELLDIFVRIMKDEIEAEEEWMEASERWPQEKAVRCMEVVKEIVKASGVFIGEAGEHLT